jgi:arabinan endo-1,5-alpha-L-arabinosidase
LIGHAKLIHRGALLAGAVAVALAGGCKYDLDKLKGAEVADASGGVGGGGGGVGGGGGGAGSRGMDAPALTSEDGPEQVMPEADAAPAATDMRMPDLPPDMIPDRMSAPPMIPPETIGAPALVAYWPMEEGMGGYVYDATQNANDGTFLFEPMWQAGGFPASSGRSGWKLRFDGNDDFVEVLPKTLPDIDKPKSICFWIRLDYEVDYNRPEAMIAFLNRQGSGAGLRIEFRKGELTATSYFYNKIVALPPPPLGWHHIGYTFDGNVHTLYLNGGANINVGGMEMPGIATSMVPAEIGPANNKDGRFRMGRSSSGVADAFRGYLDDVRVYNRALSAAEVKSLSLGSK